MLRQEREMFDISVVMACLNEAETVGSCIEKAFHSFKILGLKGEVLVVDNGSTDGSPEIAQSYGARVVFEKKRGYGYACRRGLQEARGCLFVMADADGTYDLSDLKKMVHPLENGADFVIGSRLKGNMLPGSCHLFQIQSLFQEKDEHEQWRSCDGQQLQNICEFLR